MLRTWILFIFLLVGTLSNAQKKGLQFDQIEPPFWWAGMKNTNLQILFHNKSADLQGFTVSTSYPGAIIKETRKVENPHYLFVNLDLASAKSGSIPFVFSQGKKSFTVSYALRDKSTAGNRIQGFNSSDVM